MEKSFFLELKQIKHKDQVFGSVRSSGSQSVCLSVCPSGTSLSKALNLHLSLIVLSQICLRSVSGHSRVSLRSALGQSQVILRSLFAYFVRQTEPKILRLVIDRGLIYTDN